MDNLELVPNSGWDSRVLVYACGDLVQVFSIVTERYVIIVDSLLNEKTALALLDLARPHITDGRQLLVVNSHADWDHAWGNQVFAGPTASYPVPVIGSERCAERLRSQEDLAMLERMRSKEPERFAGVQLVPPTITFNDQLMIDGGDLSIHLFPTPGHQPDHISIFIPEIGMVLAGDAAEEPFPIVNTANDLHELRGSLARMAALQPQQALYCHAPVDSGPALLQRNQAYFDRLQQHCQAALANGLTLPLADDADVEALISFPLSAALPAGLDPSILPETLPAQPPQSDSCHARSAYTLAKTL